MIPYFLSLPDRRLAYQRLIGDTQKPGIIFLGGYASDMTGTKANFLAEHCSAAGLSFVRFDYRGNGQSSGDFKECTLGDWLADTSVTLDRVTEGDQIIVGSSMGGWLALLLARLRPNRIKAIIGVAAAPDFTEELIVPALTLPQRLKLEEDGFILDPTSPPEHPTIITQRLIIEARQHLVLGDPIALPCPLHLLQGMGDKEVPWKYALRIMDKVARDDARVTLIKDGDHRLSRTQDLDLLWRTVQEFV